MLRRRYRAVAVVTGAAGVGAGLAGLAAAWIVLAAVFAAACASWMWHAGWLAGRRVLVAAVRTGLKTQPRL